MVICSVFSGDDTEILAESSKAVQIMGGDRGVSWMTAVPTRTRTTVSMICQRTHFVHRFLNAMSNPFSSSDVDQSRAYAGHRVVRVRPGVN